MHWFFIRWLPNNTVLFWNLSWCLSLLVISENPQSFVFQPGRGAFHWRRVNPATTGRACWDSGCRRLAWARTCMELCDHGQAEPSGSCLFPWLPLLSVLLWTKRDMNETTQQSGSIWHPAGSQQNSSWSLRAFYSIYTEKAPTPSEWGSESLSRQPSSLDPLPCTR